jgi:hypothetical protein
MQNFTKSLMQILKKHSKIHKLINSSWNEEDLPDQWKESIIVPIHRKGDKTDCSNYRGGFDVTDQLLIRSFAFVRYWRKNGSTMGQYIICS